MSSMMRMIFAAIALGLGLAALVGSRQVRTASSPPGVRLTAPAPLTEVAPGQTVRVRCESLGGFRPVGDGFLLACGSESKMMQSVPFETDLTIPLDANGPIDVGVLAHDNSGLIAADAVSVSCKPRAAVLGLEIVPEIVSVKLAHDYEISVVGAFADGVTREFNLSTDRIEFTILDTNIATVNSRGLIEARRPGETRIRVSLGKLRTEARLVIFE